VSDYQQAGNCGIIAPQKGNARALAQRLRPRAVLSGGGRQRSPAASDPANFIHHVWQKRRAPPENIF